ncbi:hypothetical protein PF007_g20564 [Phytophthora fragariae]|uniref:FYVE-type domain-containing protein n=1 Tax=Phytophthora fragariae TaxID=53985 RepID=A0A6A3R0D6_9STRA|nr:hypothetical protein PF003_g13126 [Phytophthora fragariae]KAE9086950.1 hypothetical protein PF007_g20564 [Phytophthora fragariae]KAE9115375.1 hypothetical protein PF006_g19302 [Phytophthora fragariae]
MARGAVFASPFKAVTISAPDTNQLQAVAKTILQANFERYRRFMDVDEGRVDPNEWKLVRTKDQVGVYLERPSRKTFSPFQVHPVAVQSVLQPLLCVGPTPGTLDNVMLGVASREDSNDLSRAAALSTLQTPTTADPFQSVAVKWTELDVRLKSMGLVKNHDCVYVEATGIQHLPSGERVGYQLLHSVDIREAHKLPGRVRAQLSLCSFFRQVASSLVFVYTLGMMEPMSDRARRVVLPHFVNTLLSTFKGVPSTKSSRVSDTLSTRYSELKKCENCITCSQRSRRRTSSVCNVCSGSVCNSCTVVTKLSFMTPELDMVQREFMFCSSCANEEDVSDFSFRSSEFVTPRRRVCSIVETVKG